MVEALLISNIILWIAVVILSLLVFALTRQVGILHERVAPAGALMPTSGPKVGELTNESNRGGIDDQGNPEPEDVVYVKMLKSSNQRVDLPQGHPKIKKCLK